MIALLLATAPPARALDLDLAIGVPHREPVAATLRDVGAGAPVGLVVPGGEGKRYLVQVEVRPAGEAYRLAFEVQALETSRAGRTRARTVARPTLVVAPGEPARLYQGPAPAADAADPGDRLTIEAVVRDPA